MAPIDASQHYSAVAASNSSRQIVEIMALHQTISAQVEEITSLHKTIQDQIKVTEQQGKAIRWLSYFVAALTIVQTAVTVVQIFPVNPELTSQIGSGKQQVRNWNNPPTNGVRTEAQPMKNDGPSVGKKP